MYILAGAVLGFVSGSAIVFLLGWLRMIITGSDGAPIWFVYFIYIIIYGGTIVGIVIAGLLFWKTARKLDG